MNREGRDGFGAALTNLGTVLSKMMAAKAAADRVKLEKERLEADRQRLDELKKKADRATMEAAAKLKPGRSLTIDEINRIRERTFGLPPIKKMSPEELGKKIDQVYGIDRSAPGA